MSRLTWLTFFKPTHPYFIMDPEVHGPMYFMTAEERDREVKQIIANYMQDGEWGNGVDHIHVGVVTGCARKDNITYRPEDDDMEDDVDGSGISWAPGIDYMCDYVVDDITIKSAVLEQ